MFIFQIQIYIIAQIKDEDGKNKNKYEGYDRVYLYMRMFFGLFIAWAGYNILLNEQLNETDQKYMKESLTLLKNMTNYFYPNLLKNTKYNFDDAINKTSEIIMTICYMFIIGGILVAIGYKIGKYIIIMSLLIDILFTKNIFYLRGEKLKVNVFKFISFFGGALYL